MNSTTTYNVIVLIKAAALLNRRKSWRVLNNADLLHSLTLALLQNLLFTAYVASYLKDNILTIMEPHKCSA